MWHSILRWILWFICIIYIVGKTGCYRWRYRMHVGVVSRDIAYIDMCPSCLMLGVWCDWWLHIYDDCEFVVLINNVEVKLSLNLNLSEVVWYVYIFSIIYVDYDWCEVNLQWFWPPTCLNEWVDGVQEWSFSCLVSCLRTAGASSVYLLES